ncbi:CgeB family protein [Spirosoma arcticum]
MAKILYLGDSDPNTTSAHRANALIRLGHTVVVKDPNKIISESPGLRFIEPLHYRTGYRFLQHRLVRWVQVLVNTIDKPDLIWVSGGELLGKECLKLLKKFSCPIVLYNNDDPTGGRDGRRFDLLLKALPYYDLCAVMRGINIPEYKAKGAHHVLKVYMSYDEVAHQPFAQVSDIPIAYQSNVAFVGTWMRNEKRDEFLLELIRQGVPLSIWGNSWKKSPHWKALQVAYCGSALSGRDYVAAVQGTKICLGFLSKGNRDLHTQRSLEVPFAGGLLCAERTSEHLAMYREGIDAVFWSDAQECARICHQLLDDASRREAIRSSGMHRVRELRVGNEDVCKEVLNAAFGRPILPESSYQ